MSELFTERAKKVLENAQAEARFFKQDSVATEHLLLALIKEQKGIASKVLKQLNIDEVLVFDEVEQITQYGNKKSRKEDLLPYSPRTKQILSYASMEAKRINAPSIGTEHMLLALIRDEEVLGSRVLTNLDVNLNKVRNLIYKKIGLVEPSNKQGQRKQPVNQGNNKPQEEGTPTLDSLARDLTQSAREKRLDPLLGREKEVQRLIQVLSRRTKNNPVLVGEPGVGKTAIAEGLAQRIVEGLVPKEMLSKRLMMLDMGAVVAGTKYRGEFEDRMKKVVDEIYRDGNVILFIDELHTLIGAGGAEGAIDASNILKPALARGELQTIGATTLDEYQKYIEKDSALERRFAKIQVDEPTPEEAEDILLGLRGRYEEYHKVKITDEAVHAAVNLATRYISDRQLPDKAIDLIDESAARARLELANKPSQIVVQQNKLEELLEEKEAAILAQNFELAADLRKKEQRLMTRLENLKLKEAENEGVYQTEVTEEAIVSVVAQWTGIPLKQLEKKETERLLELEKVLHERVVGQDEAVKAISKAIRRSRSGLSDPNRPIGSFMFLGPTGVGKTELAKTLASTMFGSEDALIRVDMSEFMEKHSTSRLVGSPPGYVGYDEGGQLTERIRQKPYSVILLDEVEKAHPDVFNILLQVLDDGHLTDSKGRKVNFKNTILIMTSNIGATALRDEKTVGFAAKDATKNHEAMKSRVLEELKKRFRPEFLNRVDEMLVFHSLTKEELHEIVKIMSQSIIERLKLQKIDLKLTPAAIEVVSKAGFDPEYGARPIRRALQKEVEDKLSDMLLLGEITPNSKVVVGASKGEIQVKVTPSKKK
ncbi:ATP-dependent Clp protease ATP-binding subunit [Vagococcus fluvialis]|uniref:ATP-dependent Clp protease ATP-binding subunit n=1 Tax=Vagococcus fluvialis TaxID=2738 RepID=UPI001A8C158F|nr:ATP-dependent Clp protease ATP-binding subunit [Vagococcus fluvialis]MBO0478786.1 ATP-dependent Clp protease ATP-binding subunit [Vagococcus fluvialis]MBO0483414.1 ATP-dependent Clp protease ATP-binding subunit [Vagococcus fluvialis]UDM71402.1 ATP-dependent Clp protease ATP-binding subunit [Vagococcus fluvialis]UDM76264.1 ATP-dependent Clp protease ATP-binding subunit [Vagococcus fluvialis]UDM83095.1 ATP-dependent Clp protease ATP-binding subunit [Vagococcus fluvialis]